ncbi:MAG: hypothetical protein ACPL25_08905 [Ignavibacteria bacterium]
MRVLDILSNIKTTLNNLGLQSGRGYFTDEQIIREINSAQTFILANHYPLKGSKNFDVLNGVDGFEIPDYIGKIVSVSIGDELTYIDVSDYLHYKIDNIEGRPIAYTFIDNYIVFAPIPNDNYQAKVVFYYQTPPEPANGIDKDIFLPTYYDQAIEYYTLGNLLIKGDKDTIDAGNQYIRLSIELLKELAGHSSNKTKPPKPKGDW